MTNDNFIYITVLIKQQKCVYNIKQTWHGSNCRIQANIPSENDLRPQKQGQKASKGGPGTELLSNSLA